MSAENFASMLRITPDKTLEFEAVGGAQAPVVLKLENAQSTHTAFKIKTTAPKSYLVKPSSGVLEPNGSLEVNILLIPLFEPPKEPITDRSVNFIYESMASNPVFLFKQLHVKAISLFLGKIGQSSALRKTRWKRKG